MPSPVALKAGTFKTSRQGVPPAYSAQEVRATKNASGRGKVRNYVRLENLEGGV